jgi:hypothetical protein
VTREEVLEVLTRYAQALDLGTPGAAGEDTPVWYWSNAAERYGVSMDQLFARFQEVAAQCGWKLTPGDWETEHNRLICAYDGGPFVSDDDQPEAARLERPEYGEVFRHGG